MTGKPEINIGGGVGGHLQVGDHNTAGDVTTTSVGSGSREDLLDALRAVRELLAANASEVPRYEVTVDAVDELALEASKPSGDAGFARRVWLKLRGLLAGTAEVGGDLARLGEHVTTIDAAITGVFG